MASVDLPLAFSKALFVENPIVNDDDPSFYTREPITVRQLTSILRLPSAPPGTPLVTWRLRFGPNRDATGTAIVNAGSTTTAATPAHTTTGHVITTFDNASIPANSWVWLELTAVTTLLNRPLSFSVTIDGDES